MVDSAAPAAPRLLAAVVFSRAVWSFLKTRGADRMADETVRIYWLTRDFRFSDNAALAAAAEGMLLPVFVIDRQLRAQGAASRWRVERALRCFDRQLRDRAGRGVTVLQGEPEALLPELAARTGAREVHQGDWPAPDMRRTQVRVRNALAAQDARLVLHPGHLLAHPQRVRTRDGGTYRVYTPFARALRVAGPDRPGPAVPARISLSPEVPAGMPLERIDLAPDLHGGRGVLDEYALPAGEEAALARLDDFLARAGSYGRDRDHPDPEATSGLSEHLALGEISPRTVWAAAELRRETDPSRAAGIDKFLAELIWREFAWHLLIDFPQMAEKPWREEWAGFAWRGDNADFTRWRRGNTGVALVDAGLREMRVTGRMHNRVRMVVASWLTKHLLTDWRLGLAHFADSLTDWDPAANAMNWQWVAGCGPDASPFFRIFNPEKQADQYDPQGFYRRRWLAGREAASPGSLAYFDTIPPGWNVSRVWRETADATTMTEGRNRALSAYADFKTARDA